ncbi:hypothetical protein D1007_43572 [Hordeum vulgare]|nr:hypothetical protein D1007_43572 [Hordeum vulgare]
MAVEKLPEVNPPFGRVSGRGLLTLLISEALRRRNDEEIRDSVYDGRVSDRRGKYKPKEGVRGRGAHATRGQAAQGGRLGIPWLPSGPPLVLRKLPSR